MNSSQNELSGKSVSFSIGFVLSHTSFSSTLCSKVAWREKKICLQEGVWTWKYVTDFPLMRFQFQFLFFHCTLYDYIEKKKMLTNLGVHYSRVEEWRSKDHGCDVCTQSMNTSYECPPKRSSNATRLKALTSSLSYNSLIIFHHHVVGALR